jgi:hypothetical protein
MWNIPRILPDREIDRNGNGLRWAYFQLPKSQKREEKLPEFSTAPLF